MVLVQRRGQVETWRHDAAFLWMGEAHGTKMVRGRVMRTWEALMASGVTSTKMPSYRIFDGVSDSVPT